MREAVLAAAWLLPLVLAGCLAGDPPDAAPAPPSDGAWFGDCERVSSSVQTTQDAANAFLPEEYQQDRRDQTALVGFVIDRCPAFSHGELLEGPGFLAVAYILLADRGGNPDHAYVIHVATNVTALAADLRGAGLPVVGGVLHVESDGPSTRWAMDAEDARVEVSLPKSFPMQEGSDNKQEFLFHHADVDPPLPQEYLARKNVQQGVVVRAMGGPFDGLVISPSPGYGASYEGILEFQIN